MSTAYTPKTGARCHCKRGQERDNCPACEGTGWQIDFKRIHAAGKPNKPQGGAATLSGCYRTADGAAMVEWRIEQKEHGPEFSASGEYDRASGQCLDDIARAYPQDAQVQRIVAVWKVYHLNGMTSGTPAQNAEIERRKILAEDHARAQSVARRYFYDEFYTQPNWHVLCKLFGHDSFYSWECAVLKEAGLYEVPYVPGMECTGGLPAEVLNGTRGYRFGERWLYVAIPESVLAEIAAWSAFGKDDGRSLKDCQTEEFLSRHGLKLAMVRGSKPAPWQPSGHHYRITVKRGRTVPGVTRLAFDFWGSQADAEAGQDPRASSVFSCMASDIHTPSTFEDFCGEYGYEQNSRSTLQTFKRAAAFADKLRAFFTDEQQDELNKLR